MGGSGIRSVEPLDSTTKKHVTAVVKEMSMLTNVFVSGNTYFVLCSPCAITTCRICQ
jgi:hypothetical protein